LSRFLGDLLPCSVSGFFSKFTQITETVVWQKGEPAGPCKTLVCPLKSIAKNGLTPLGFTVARNSKNTYRQSLRKIPEQ
jgi:hypothetical protein